MSTHKRAWTIRAGVIGLIAAAGLVGIASPATAAGSLQIGNAYLDPSAVSGGGETTVHFSITNSDANSVNVSKVEVTSDPSKVSCSSTCSFSNVTVGGNGTWQPPTAVKMKATGTFSGTQTVQITINASPASPQGLTLTVSAPAQQASVPEVSGVVVNRFTNEAIKGAKVFIQDSANPAHTWDNVGTDDAGNFKIVSTQEKPIAAGLISFRVEKDGIEPYTTTKTATANQPLTGVRLTVAPLNASASASASAAPSLTANVTDTLGDNTAAAANEPNGSGLSWVLIAVGGVLVLLGIAAIVLIFVRKKDDGDGEDGPGHPGPGRGGPGRGPGAPGGPRPPPGQRRGGPPDRTAPMRGGPGYPPRPVSPGPRGADQTMIARSPLADAPTQMHGRMPDQNDPYGGRPGYPQQPGAYGPPPGGYGQPPAGQPPAGPPGAYGPPPGGYTQQSYGAPTAGGYGQPYGQTPEYGQPDPRQQQRPAPPQQGGEGRRVDWLDD